MMEKSWSKKYKSHYVFNTTIKDLKIDYIVYLYVFDEKLVKDIL